MSLPLQARYGFKDHELKGSASVRFERANGAAVQMTGFRKYRELSDEAERSRAVNTIAAQEFGSDYSDQFDARGISLRVKSPALGGMIPSLEFVGEKQGPLKIHARSAFGSFESTPEADSVREVRSMFSIERPNRIGVIGFEISGRLSAEYTSWKPLGCCLLRSGNLGRIVFSANFEKPFGGNRIVLHTYAGTVRSPDAIPAQHRFFLGGPVTAPGYDFHALVGSSALSQRIELRFPVAFPPLSLGRYGRTPPSAPLAPYFNIAGVSGGNSPRAMTTARTAGWYPSVGVGILPMFELVRFDVARGFRNGRWTFSFDLNRDFWNIL